MKSKKTDAIKFNFILKVGNQIHVTNKKLNRNNFQSYRDLQKEEDKPFEPIRPRLSLMRLDKQSRVKLESQFKVKLKAIKRQPSQVAANSELQKGNRQNKEEWMLDLQEIYDKIHEELQKLIKYQQSSQKLSLEQQQEFKDLLDQQMLKTEATMARLQTSEQLPLQSSREGLLIAKQFRQSLKELYYLMQSVQITQLQTILATNFEYVKKLRQLRSKQLIKEIRNSTERLNKVRIGNDLDQIIQKQKTSYEK